MRKPTDTFPYGYYRAETLAALACSGIILYLGGHLLCEGIERVREGTAEQALMAYAAGDLEYLSAPTHSSEVKLAELGEGE